MVEKAGLNKGYIHTIFQPGTTFTSTASRRERGGVQQLAVAVLCADFDGLKQLADSSPIIQVDGTGMTRWRTKPGGRKLMVITLLPGGHGQKVFFAGVTLFLLNCATADVMIRLLQEVKALLKKQGRNKQPQAVKVDLDRTEIKAFQTVWPNILILFELFHVDAAIDDFCYKWSEQENKDEGAQLLALFRVFRFASSEHEALATRGFIMSTFSGNKWKLIQNSTLAIMLDHPGSACVYGRQHLPDKHKGPAEQEGHFQYLKNVHGLNDPTDRLPDLIHNDMRVRLQGKAKQLQWYEANLYQVQLQDKADKMRESRRSTSDTNLPTGSLQMKRKRRGGGYRVNFEKRVEHAAEKTALPTAKDRRHAFEYARSTREQASSVVPPDPKSKPLHGAASTVAGSKRKRDEFPEEQRSSQWGPPRRSKKARQFTRATFLSRHASAVASIRWKLNVHLQHVLLQRRPVPAVKQAAFIDLVKSRVEDGFVGTGEHCCQLLKLSSANVFEKDETLICDSGSTVPVAPEAGGMVLQTVYSLLERDRKMWEVYLQVRMPGILWIRVTQGHCHLEDVNGVGLVSTFILQTNAVVARPGYKASKPLVLASFLLSSDSPDHTSVGVT